MRDSGIFKPAEAGTSPRTLIHAERFRVAGWIAFVAAITLMFLPDLTDLVVYALRTDLHSHIPFVPLLAAYLLAGERFRTPASFRISPVPATILGIIGLIAIGLGARFDDALSPNDYLSVVTLAYLCFITAGGFVFFGSRPMRAAVFPISFLLFMIPLPDLAVYWLERGLVLASAETSALLFRLTRTPLLHVGTVLSLPGVVLQVAQECSGIRSTWVLFITSLVASRLLLKSPWRRAALVALVVPLGIVRNAFRIVVIGLLCVHVGPHMIDSPLHRRGGPVFFALSLVPLLLTAMWLHRRERRHVAQTP